MNGQPLVSVVIPTFNRAHCLGAAVDSVLAQTYRDLEIIIIDDGSTDATDDIVKAIVDRNADSPASGRYVRYLKQPNGGPSAARNKGIEVATGEWIAFLDSDDTWLPAKLELQMRAIRQFAPDCGACYTNARLVDSRGLDITAFAQGGIAYQDATGVASDAVMRLATSFGGRWIQTLLARLDLVRGLGGFDSKVEFGEDYDFLFRLALVTTYCYVNEMLAVIDRTTAVIDPTVTVRSWDRVDFRLRARQYMYEKWLGLSSQYSGEVRRAIVRSLRGVHSCWANWYLENARFKEARRAAFTAMTYEITPQLMVKWLLTWGAPHLARRLVPSTQAML